jgi:K+-transporting ATPase ATPase C chain
MLTMIRASVVSTLFFTALLGLGYPLLVTGIAGVAFPAQAGGSLLHDKAGHVIGSSLLAQGFARPEYLHPRPSAAGSDGYDASASSGSNLGPTNPALKDRIVPAADALRAENGGQVVPADAVTTSGSGLDPDISPANARMQAARIARARGATTAAVETFIVAHTTQPLLGVFGQPRVNVLQTNLALDAAFPLRRP